MVEAVPGMKFETQPGVSFGIKQKQGKNGVNSYGVFVGMGFTHEFFLRPEEVNLFPPKDVQCVIYGEVEETKFGTKFKVGGYNESSTPSRRRATPSE